MTESCGDRALGQAVAGADHIRRAGAYAVIPDDLGRVACVRTEYGLFLPGGGLEVGEDPVDAVVREVLEECGLRVEVVESLGPVEEYHSSRDGTEHWLLMDEFFRCRVIDERIHPSEPDHVLEWVPRTVAAQEMLREGHRWILKRKR